MPPPELLNIFRTAVAFASGQSSHVGEFETPIGADPATQTVRSIGEAIGEALASVRASRPLSNLVLRELRGRAGLVLPRALDMALGRTLETLETNLSEQALLTLAAEIESALADA